MESTQQSPGWNDISEEYKIIEALGKGQFGEVMKA